MSGETLIEKTYSSSEIQRIAKITKMQAIHWTQTGIITPLQDAHGRGSRRVYSWSNLIEMMICRDLNKYSIEKGVLGHVIRLMGEKSLFPTKTGDMIGYDSYWDFYNQNPKTNLVLLVICRFDPEEFVNWSGGSIYLGDRKEAGMRLREFAKVLEGNYKSDETRQLAKKLNYKLAGPVVGTIMEKNQLQDFAELYSSFVVVNVSKFIAESKKG